MEKCLAWHQVGAVAVAVQRNLDKHPVAVDSKEPAKYFAVVVVDSVHCIPGIHTVVVDWAVVESSMDSVEVVRCILADQVLALAAGGGSVVGGIVVGWGISFVVVEKLVVDLVLQRPVVAVHAIVVFGLDLVVVVVEEILVVLGAVGFVVIVQVESLVVEVQQFVGVVACIGW